MGSVFLLFLFIILPYSLYFKKRYKDSLDKKLFVREHLSQSMLWILLLVLVPYILVNLFFDSENEIKNDIDTQITTVEEFTVSIDSLESVRYENIENIEYHFLYLSRCFDSNASNRNQRDEALIYYRQLKDSLHTDHGNFGIGFSHFYKNQLDSAIYYLSKVESDEIKYHHFCLAKIYIQKEERDKALEQLLEELRIENGHHETAIFQAVYLAEELENNHALLEIAYFDYAKDYIGEQYVRKVMFNNFQATTYYNLVLDYVTRNLNLVGFIAALLILGVWLNYLVKLTFFEKIKWGLVTSALLLGMTCCFFVFPISDTLQFGMSLWEEESSLMDLLSYSVFGIGAVEEIVKIIPLLLILLRVKLAPYEYILLASISALGFAFIENLIYFDGTYGQIIHGRALTAAVGHMIFSSIFAYGLVLSKYKYEKLKAIPAFFLFWFLASLGHGFYDFWLFAELYLFFILFFFFIARVWVTIINNSLNNSPAFNYDEHFNTKAIQFYLAFSLTTILIFEYVSVAFLEGASTANASLFTSSISGSFMIMFLGTKLSSLNLIKDYWGKINYSVNPFTDDIVSQNFMGQQVWLSTYYVDQGLVEYYPDGVNAIIKERVVLKNRESTLLFSYEDPDWFVIELAVSHTDPNFKNNLALIKFRDSHSSLNDQKFFEVKFLMIPSEMEGPKIMRKNYHSLGWAFLRTAQGKPDIEV